MASLEQLWIRAQAAVKCTKRVVDDTPVVLRIKHVGSGIDQAPTAVISSSSSLLTLTDGAAAATAIDLSATAYNTVGEVADYINGLASWECKVVDALRADASDNKWIDGSITAAVKNGETVFDVLQDTSAMAELKVRVAYDELIGSTRAKGSHRVTLTSFTYYADLTAAADKIQIYEYDIQGKTETKIWSATSVDTTLVSYAPSSTTYPFQGITATEGKELVIVVTGTVIDNAANYVQADFIRE